MNNAKYTLILTFIVSLAMIPWLQADPCGMVPPIYSGPGTITRTGLQKTYVFHKDGVETFVIRPGFQGKVDNFGMLIPFPNPPELRKVADNVFEHVANAVDPPEVVVDLRIRRMMMRNRGAMPAAMAADSDKALKFKDQVNVLKEEAVGMYQVAVLEAGSATALKKWMDENGYKYPDGMDKVTNDYVDDGWCFVAVKTKVGQKEGVNPKPGARDVKRNIPDGSVFDGNVQGMGFRFKSEKLVVPMRLSAFNEGDLRNVVYLLTDGPQKIRAIPEEYVMRQISGKDLISNVTDPLPLRIIGGTEKDIPDYQRRTLPAQRNPEPKNGIAKELFASDMLAVATGELSLKHEEEEKELLRIGEHFGLRGAQLDNENAIALKEARDATTKKGLSLLEDMTLTVVDGDFPREVISRDNLTFAQYKMPAARNNPLNYDATNFGPGLKKEGVLKTGSIDWNDVDRRIVSGNSMLRIGVMSMVGFAMLGMVGTLFYRRPKVVLLVLLGVGFLAGTAFSAEPALQGPVDDTLIEKLENSKTASEAIESLRKAAMESEDKREKIVGDLLKVVKTDESLSKRGWAIAALAEIGGQDVDEYLLNVHADEGQKTIVRTWAAAARVSMTRTVNGLIEKANLIPQFPALGRPIGMRIVEKMSSESADVDPEKVLGVSIKVPQLNSALAPMIMTFGTDKLTDVMFHAKDQNIRRTAAGYLAAMAQQGEKDKVSKAVLESLKFNPGEMSVPWKNGPLFVPGINWTKEDATSLVANLVRWHLWCDINGKKDEMSQIHNNIRSLALANAAGYQSPGWRESDVNAWLKAWGAVVGKEGIQKILDELNVADNPKYSAVLNEL